MEQFDSSNLMYVTKKYENDIRETAKQIYANDEVKLTIENIDKQLNDILIEMNDKLNFITGKIHDPDTGVDAYLKGVHTQIDNIDSNARDMIDEGLEKTKTHPSVMGVKSDRNATKFNTYDFINKSIRLDQNSPLLRFNSTDSINDNDNVHTFKIKHDNSKEYIKVIEFSFTYKQYPSVFNKTDDGLQEEQTVTVTRVISGRFFIIWEDPFNEPGKFIIKAIVENADNTGNLIDKKIIDVKELNKTKEANYKNWKDSKLADGNFPCIIVANDGTLVAGSYSNGIWYSKDNGETWIQSSISDSDYQCIIVANNGRLIAGSSFSAGIKYSDDNGVTWNDSNITSFASYKDIVVTKDGTLVACGSITNSDNIIVYSNDNGEHWNSGVISAGNYYCIIEARDGTLVVGGDIGIKYSIDSGKTWNDTDVKSVTCRNFIITQDGTIIVSTNSGIYYSKDDGKSWKYSYTCGGDCLFVGLANDGRLMACVNNYHGIKYSDDNGETWIQSDRTNGNYRSITVAQDGTLLACGSSNNGIYYSTDNGITWDDTNLVNGNYYCVTVTQNGTLITSGIGIKYLNTVKTEIEDISVILDDGPQFDLYFTSDGDEIDISIGRVVPYRWLMRKGYVTVGENKPTDNFEITETVESPNFDQSNVFYSKVTNTFFIVDKENKKISYVIGGNKFNNSIPLSPSTAIPYNGEEITDFRLMETSTFAFVTINNQTFISLNNFDSFELLSKKVLKVYELSTKEVVLLCDNKTFYLFDVTTSQIVDIPFAVINESSTGFDSDLSLVEYENDKVIIFMTTPTGFSYQVKKINESTHTYGANSGITGKTVVDNTVLTTLNGKNFTSSNIKAINDTFGLFVLVNHINNDETISNVVYFDELVTSGTLSSVFKTTNVLKEFDYINKEEKNISSSIKDIKCTSMFMFGICDDGSLSIIDPTYVTKAIVTIPVEGGYSDEKSMLYLEKEEDAEDIFLVEKPYLNDVIDVFESPNGIILIDKYGVYELKDNKELHCITYTEDNFISSIPFADLNNTTGIFVAKNGDSYKFYKTDYNTKIIPREHLKYRYIDLFNDKYQKYVSDNSADYSDEYPIVKFNSILYVNLIDHLSTLYNTDKFDNITYSTDKTYGEVKLQLPITKNFNQILNNGMTNVKVSEFINKKFILSTNKYGFKKYKDIIKLDDTNISRVSDINELKRYVIRNRKGSNIDLETISANIIRLLSDEYDFVIGEDKTTERVSYTPVKEFNNNTGKKVEITNNPEYTKKYYTSVGVISNAKSTFTKLVETPIGAFVNTVDGKVYYVPLDKLKQMTDEANVDTVLGTCNDIVAINGWNAKKFIPHGHVAGRQEGIIDFDVKYIKESGHDTVIIVGNGFVALYECLDPEYRTWTAPFSNTENVQILEAPNKENGFTNVYVDGINIYLWNNIIVKPLYRYNVVTKTFDQAFENITNTSIILNINKINNDLHIISNDRITVDSNIKFRFTYSIINLISNNKTIINDNIQFNYNNSDQYQDTIPDYGLVKSYETDKAFIFFIYFNCTDEDTGLCTIFKYTKNGNNDNKYTQVKFNNAANSHNVTFNGFTICKDIKNNYKLIGIIDKYSIYRDNLLSNFPDAFIYNEETDIITPLDIVKESSYEIKTLDPTLDIEYNRFNGSIDLYAFNTKNDKQLAIEYSISIPGMYNSKIDDENKVECTDDIVFDNTLYTVSGGTNGSPRIIQGYKNYLNKEKQLVIYENINDKVLNYINQNINYFKVSETTPEAGKTYYTINTENMRFTPIFGMIKSDCIPAVFKRVKVSDNYVLVDTNKQKYPLYGVKYYVKDMNGNYQQKAVTSFEKYVRYYELEYKFVPVDVSTLVNVENNTTQYYRADIYEYEVADVGETFDSDKVYFERQTVTLDDLHAIENKSLEHEGELVDEQISTNIIPKFIVENNNLYLIVKTNCKNILINIKYIIDYNNMQFDSISYGFDYFDENRNSQKSIFNVTEISNNEFIVGCIDELTSKFVLFRSGINHSELYNQYCNIDVISNSNMIDKIRVTVSEKGLIFYTNLSENKTYKLNDDYSGSIIVSSSYPLDVFDTESGIFGVARNTNAVLIYKYNDETGIFDSIVFNLSNGTFTRGKYSNTMITMDNGFKAIFIFGVLNGRSTCYRLYKGIVSVYEDFDSEIMGLPFDYYYISTINNNIIIAPEKYIEFSGSIKESELDNMVYIIDVINHKKISRFNTNFENKVLDYDFEKINIMSNSAELYKYESRYDLYEHEGVGKSLSPIDPYNVTLPIIDKDGMLWYKNSRVDIKTGLPDVNSFYRAFDSDGKTILHDHIIFNDMVATEDGIFGVKNGEIYLNKSFSNSNDFVLVFRSRYSTNNYTLDKLVVHKRFGLFFTNYKNIYRWNGSKFEPMFKDEKDSYDEWISSINITQFSFSRFDYGINLKRLYTYTNQLTEFNNNLFYISENKLLAMLTDSNNNRYLYYYDYNENNFKLVNINRTSLFITFFVETSLGTIFCDSSYTDSGNDNVLYLLTYKDSELIASRLNITGFLNKSDTIDKDDDENQKITDIYNIVEDPISKLILINNDRNLIGEYAIFNYVISSSDVSIKAIIEATEQCLFDDTEYQIFGNRICTFKDNKIKLFNFRYNENKSGIELFNEQIINNVSFKPTIIDDEMMYITSNNDGLNTGCLNKLIYDKEVDSYNIKVINNINSLRTIHDYIVENTEDFVNEDNMKHYGLLWNDIFFISMRCGILQNRNSGNRLSHSLFRPILLSYGKTFERTVIPNNSKTNRIGFDFTITIKNSDKFNNLDEITENSLVDKLVIKTTGVFTKNSITNLKSYIINIDRTKNIKELTSKYPTVFNMFKNIYKKFDNKNLKSYRFKDILSQSEDCIVLGSVEEIKKSEFSNFMKSILKISSLDDDYKIDINVYPAAVTDIIDIKETLPFESSTDDAPDLSCVAYLPFNPFR